MSGVPFGWMWGDPAAHLDRLRSVRSRLEAADKEFRAREIKRNQRRIRKLVKAAKAQQLKGQR